jgi:hypothetical protein
MTGGRRTPSQSPLGAVARGVVAGVAGTAALTVVQTATALRRGAGLKDAVAPDPPDSWDEAPAPGQVGERLIRFAFARDVEPDHANAVTNVVHWTYGAAWGGAFGLVQATLRRSPVAAGGAFAVAVLGAAYALLPAMGVYRKPWEYPPSTLAIDGAYHMVYGVTTALAFRLLEP